MAGVCEVKHVNGGSIRKEYLKARQSIYVASDFKYYQHTLPPFTSHIPAIYI